MLFLVTAEKKNDVVHLLMIYFRLLNLNHFVPKGISHALSPGSVGSCLSSLVQRTSYQTQILYVGTFKAIPIIDQMLPIMNSPSISPRKNGMA